MMMLARIVVGVVASGIAVAAQATNSTNPCAILAASEAVQAKSNATSMYYRNL
jgi:hypothetical protein